MTYAPEYEKELLHRSHRCRMRVSGAPCSTPQQQRTSENLQHSREILNAISSSTSSRAAVLGGFCPVTSRLGRPFTGGLGGG
jgi:hypothetical protein